MVALKGLARAPYQTEQTAPVLRVRSVRAHTCPPAWSFVPEASRWSGPMTLARSADSKVATALLQATAVSAHTIKVASVLHLAATAATHHLVCGPPALTPSISVACRGAVATFESASSCQRHRPGPSAGLGHERPGRTARLGPRHVLKPISTNRPLYRPPFP